MREIREKLRNTRGRKFWTSLEEIADEPEFQAWLTAEFPAAAEVPQSGRREFLRLMAASFALAGLAGCGERSRADLAAPYVEQPEYLVPGVPRYYATAMMFGGYAQPVIATSYDGRPTKLDGNPEHPIGSGAGDIFTQASILSLYDPDRSNTPLHDGAPASWADFQRDIATYRDRWKAVSGKGVHLLIGHTTSATSIRQLTQFLAEFPQATLHLFEPASDARDGSIEIHHDLSQCEVLVSIEDDVVGPGPHQVRNASAWSSRRGEKRPGDERMRMYVAESTPSLTGSVADNRIPVDVSRLPDIAAALAQAVGVSSAVTPRVSAKEQAWIKGAALDLQQHGAHSLLAIGGRLPLEIQALAPLVNQKLGNSGTTVRYSDSLIFMPQQAGTLDTLVSAMTAGDVDALIVIDSNPAYAAPGVLAFADAMGLVRNRIHFGYYADETARLAQWHLPLAHMLESWSDGRSVDGTVTLVQPVIEPFYDIRTVHQALDMLMGVIDPDAGASVRLTWKERLGNQSDPRWLEAVEDGFIPGSRIEMRASLSPASTAVTAAVTSSLPNQLDIVFRPDPTIWDGRFANIGWLQELPKPLTKITWDNVVLISPALAERMTLTNGDDVEITVGTRSVVGPAWIMPGQASNTITLFFGYGRKNGGHIAGDIGYNAYAVRPSPNAWHAVGTLSRAKGEHRLATTQLHHRMDGFDLVREVTAAKPAFAKPAAQPSFYPEWPGTEIAWGMVIDLDLCIGCNACVTACTAENNVAIVGREQVAMGREMQWIRVDRYYTGDVEDPQSYFQPVPCMHCEKAPCEMGCPVNATVHSGEGVNQQIYNRCIGTRTCSSYCPYKVRRFNWYDYTGSDDPSIIAAHNPDVTVRARGVMEKCTYCIQRIQGAHATADKENRAIKNGEVITACQQACPTKAIVFGDLKNANSDVAKRRQSGRHYALLEELGTRPRTTYLARWKDEGET